MCGPLPLIIRTDYGRAFLARFGLRIIDPKNGHRRARRLTRALREGFPDPEGYVLCRDRIGDEPATRGKRSSARKRVSTSSSIVKKSA